MQALVAMVFECGWPFPRVCLESVWLWSVAAAKSPLSTPRAPHEHPTSTLSAVVRSFATVFCAVGVLTVLWLKIVYTRFETTTGLPIEYGTVHACSVLGGIIFYQVARPTTF